MSTTAHNYESRFPINPPPGWRIAALRQLCREDRVIVEPRSEEASRRPYIGMEDIASHSGRLLRNPLTNAATDGASTTFAFDSRHVLYGKLRPYLNKVATLQFAGRCSTEFIPLLPADGVDRDFLAWALRRSETTDAAMKQKTGSRMPRANMIDLFGLPVPIPSLSEQRRIAAKLRGQMEAVDRASKAASERMAACDQLLAASLREAFHGITPLTAERSRDIPPRHWRWCKLGQIARLESGHTPSRYHPQWWDGDIPWLALPDIRAVDGKEVFDTLEHTNDLGIQNSSARILPKGTVVLSRTASVGFVAVMGRPMATSQDFVNWVCGDQLDSWFFAYLLMASRRYIRAISSGAVHKTVYMPAARAFEVCIPDLDEQRLITAAVARVAAGAANAAGSARECYAGINALPASLLRGAFSGGH